MLFAALARVLEIQSRNSPICFSSNSVQKTTAHRTDTTAVNQNTSDVMEIGRLKFELSELFEFPVKTPMHPATGYVAPQQSSYSTKESSDHCVPSSPPEPQSNSQRSSERRDDDGYLDRVRCETVTQTMMLAFLNAVASSYYTSTLDSLVFSFEYGPSFLIS